jgi:hypothetical protein
VKTFSARLVSVAKKGTKAQVVVESATELGKRQTVTRHVQFVGGCWTGFYPNDQALKENKALNAQARADLQSAELSYEYATQSLERLRAAQNKGVDKRTEIQIAQALVETAFVAARDAKMAVTVTEADHPVMVAFKIVEDHGPVLTRR